jgi:predicted phage baseplate assembly protein
MTLQDTSKRGRICPPNLDDRLWSDLVAEALALVPSYAPQWNDLNPSDMGVALVELFAWLVEGLIYRLNRVPDNNYIAFLNLLGITLDPPTPASVYLTFTAQPSAVVVPKGTQAQTLSTESDTPIVFETDEQVSILPINLTTVLKLTNTTYTSASALFAAPPDGGDTITIANGQTMTLCLGFDQATAAEIRLILRLFRPVRLDSGVAEASATWLYSTAGASPAAWPKIPSVTDNTSGLEQDGDVRFTPPGNWASLIPANWPATPTTPADNATDSLFWIGIQIANLIATPISIGITHLLFNAASATNALTIRLAEPLGVSDGTPFQVFSLKYQPLYTTPNTDSPYDHLVVQVDGVIWAAIDEFPAGQGNYYRINPVAGEVSFGNFNSATLTGNGSVPIIGANIVAQTYRYVAGGASGNVGPGTITGMRIPVIGTTGVTNYAAAYDGADEESIEDGKRRAPEALKTRDRAVTVEDYENLAMAVSTDIKKVRCLPPRMHEADEPGGAPWHVGDPWTFAGLLRAAGNVNVIVVSDLGHQEPRPLPPAALLRQVQQELDRKRDVTSQLRVTGPVYLPVLVNVQAFVWTKAINAGLISGALALQTQLLQSINRFLHPLTGNLDSNGWEVGASVFIADLFTAIMPDESIGFISSLTLAAETPPYFGPGAPQFQRPFSLAGPGVWVQLTDYEIVCSSTNHVVTVATK